MGGGSVCLFPVPPSKQSAITLDLCFCLFCQSLSDPSFIPCPQGSIFSAGRGKGHQIGWELQSRVANWGNACTWHPKPPPPGSRRLAQDPPLAWGCPQGEPSYCLWALCCFLASLPLPREMESSCPPSREGQACPRAIPVASPLRPSFPPKCWCCGCCNLLMTNIPSSKYCCPPLPWADKGAIQLVTLQRS